MVRALLVAFVLVCSGLGGASSVVFGLKIDPLLLAEASVVWEIVAGKDNPLWPGWDATSTPILIYVPGVEDVLINHPKPPRGFEPYTGPLSFPGGKILSKSGTTLVEWDGQNTSRAVNGVETLVVADTTSNRKMTLRGPCEFVASIAGWEANERELVRGIGF